MTLPTYPIPPSRSEARLRLVCAALRGFAANSNYTGTPGDYADSATKVADAALALLYPEPEEEMRPEDRARLVAVFEDRKRVVDMWRENGVTCYQVAPGDF